MQRSTARLKRDQAAPEITVVANALGLDEQAIIINAMGIRSAESTARSLKAPLAIDHRTSSTKRLVLTWHPIFDLSEREVWEEIADAGLEYHEVYDAFMPRLSCVLCVLAGWDVLVRAVRICWKLGIPLPERYVALEQQIGHRFKEKISMADVYAEARRLDQKDGPLIWRRGDAIRLHLGDDAATDYVRRLALPA